MTSGHYNSKSLAFSVTYLYIYLTDTNSPISYRRQYCSTTTTFSNDAYDHDPTLIDLLTLFSQMQICYPSNTTGTFRVSSPDPN